MCLPVTQKRRSAHIFVYQKSKVNRSLSKAYGAFSFVHHEMNLSDMDLGRLGAFFFFFFFFVGRDKCMGCPDER